MRVVFSCALLIPSVFFAFWGSSFYEEEMGVHRERFIEALRELQSLCQNPSYSLERVIATVSCRDADPIPKVDGAGQVFEESPVPYQLMHNGIKIVKDGYCGSWMTDLIFGLKGHHEPQEEKVFYEVLKSVPPQGVMVELGSYWAYYSLWFATAVPGAQNYLIEPDPGRLETGKRNFSLNGKEGHFFRACIGKRGNDDADFSGAPLIHLDNFLEEKGIEKVHLLHSDIQGAETEMLQSALQSMQLGKIDYFFISTHSEGIHWLCRSLLLQNGYEIVAEHTPAQSVSVDGLIAAKKTGVKGPSSIPITLTE